MTTILSTYAPYKGAYKLHPTGRQWLNPETGEPTFPDYAAAYRAVRQHLLSECDWSLAPDVAEDDPQGGIMPEGHERSWFDYGDTAVDADGEKIRISTPAL
jgi:hypothetical protein